MPGTTVGPYLGTRLEDSFALPGDFNMALLDERLRHPRLRMINGCNELNMGSAADGCARERGLAEMVVTSRATARTPRRARIRPATRGPWPRPCWTAGRSCTGSVPEAPAGPWTS